MKQLCEPAPNDFMITEYDPLELLIPLVREVVSGFIQHPDKLEVESAKIGETLTIQIRAHVDDYPKIVGMGGKNISSLTALFRVIGQKYGFIVNIRIPDKTPRSHPNNKEFENNPKWSRGLFISTLQNVLGELCETPPKINEKIVRKENGEETSMFYITPAFSDLENFNLEIEVSLETIFRAIGNQQGRRVNLSFVDAGKGDQSTGEEAQAKVAAT